MIETIISGGETGVERAALDIAIKLNIIHGGHTFEDRITEDGPLPNKYKLTGTAGGSYLVENAKASDGTLIISTGTLSKRLSDLYQNLNAEKIPVFLVDMNGEDFFVSTQNIYNWIQKNFISTIHITGDSESESPGVYSEALKLIEPSMYMSFIGSGTDPFHRHCKTNEETPDIPATIDEAVERLENAMTLKDRTTLANMKKYELERLYFTLGMYIRLQYFDTKNSPLLTACQKEHGENRKDKQAENQTANQITDDDAVEMIILKLWEKLNKTHVLRVVKH